MKFGQFVVAPILLATLLFSSSFSKNNTENANDEKFVVVLDAGHGGHDPGNLGNGYFEKNIALNIVLNVGKELEKDPNIKVIYTRKDDTFVDLYVRGEIANKANADLFVSVHCDSHSSNAYGAGTFVLGLHANKQNFEIAKKENSVIYLEDNYEKRYADYDINSPESVIGLTIMQEEFLDQSIRLAKGIQDNFSKKLKRNDRKVKQAGFIVLHQTFMPSVLVETGFLTNVDEGAYLNSKKGQAEMGTAIADAILAYKSGVQPDTYEAQVSVPESEPKMPEETDGQVESPEDVAKKMEMETVVEKEKEPIKEVAPKKPADTPTEMAKETVEALTQDASETIAAPKEEDVEAPATTASQEVITATPEEKKEPVLPTNSQPEKPEAAVANIIFKVQIMASTKDLDLRSDNFRGLNKLSREPYKNMYRYMYGSANSFQEAELLKSNADVKGYTTSFIVAYKDGERIALKEAKKYLSE